MQYCVSVSLLNNSNKQTQQTMKNQAIKKQNENGTFTYSVNGKTILNQSKKNYTYTIIGLGLFSTSLKSITNQLNSWKKYGSHSEDEKSKWEIVLIQSN